MHYYDREHIHELECRPEHEHELDDHIFIRTTSEHARHDSLWVLLKAKCLCAQPA